MSSTVLLKLGLGVEVGIDRIRNRSKALGLHKAIKDARFEMRTVLTADPFVYVDLWLRRNRKDEALFYWRQAQAFHRASRGLPMESAPLVLYYCFMSAAKALLSSKGIVFKPYHGVSAHSMRGEGGKVVLSNEGIKIKPSGIVPALAAYFGEAEQLDIHSLEDVLYNLVFIHRTYCLSYPGRRERFLPLRNVAFIRDDASAEVFLRAQAVDDADWSFFRRALPPEVVVSSFGSRQLQSAKKISWATNDGPTAGELDDLKALNRALRRVIHYINGSQTLWYLKTNHSRSIDRQPITLTLSAMHRLSEICRYKPSQLKYFLDGEKNWLLSEFLCMSPPQFLDEVACEMTGHQVMTPNVRIAV